MHVNIEVNRRSFLSPLQGKTLATTGLTVLAVAFLLSIYRTNGPEFLFLYGNFQFIPQGLTAGASFLFGMGMFAATKGRTMMTLPSGLALAAISFALYFYLTGPIRSFPPPAYGSPLPGFVALTSLLALGFVVVTAVWKVMLLRHFISIPPD